MSPSRRRSSSASLKLALVLRRGDDDNAWRAPGLKGRLLSRRYNSWIKVVETRGQPPAAGRRHHSSAKSTSTSARPLHKRQRKRAEVLVLELLKSSSGRPSRPDRTREPPFLSRLSRQDRGPSGPLTAVQSWPASRLKEGRALSLSLTY